MANVGEDLESGVETKKKIAWIEHAQCVHQAGNYQGKKIQL